MKKIMFIVLAMALVIGLCSCKKSAHRKLEFDDGTCYCFNGACGIYDEYISIGGGSISTDYKREYIIINNRAYTVTQCYCENIK